MTLYAIIFIHLLKKQIAENSLEDQWLGLCAVTAKGSGLTPGQGAKPSDVAKNTKFPKVHALLWNLIFS